MESDTRVLYTDPTQTLKVILYVDSDADTLADDFDCYSEAEFAAWQKGEWGFVTVVARVEVAYIAVGTDAMSGIEHGMLLQGGGTSDAWLLTGCTYQAVDEALTEAERWFEALGSYPLCLQAARRWFLSASA